MKLYDVTLPLSEHLAVWPGDPPVSLHRITSIEHGDPCNVSMLQMGVHSGTHIDAPCHFIQNGATIDEIPIETFIGSCLVIEIQANSFISEEDLSIDMIRGHSRIIFKTRNSEHWKEFAGIFHPNYISLSLEAAQFLVEHNVSLVGIDYLSIEVMDSKDSPVHRLLLENNVVILEGLDLSEIQAGDYDLICMPLKLIESDGAPVRVILRER